MSSTQKKLAIAGGSIALIILFALAYYFFCWMKSPTYSLMLIRDSIEKHDVMTFQKHVDLSSLLNKAFDDTIKATSIINKEDITSNPFAQGLIQIIKPSIVQALKEEILSEISNGKGTSNNSKKPPELNNFMKQFNGKTDVKNSSFKDISVESVSDNMAITRVVIHNEKSDEDFDLRVKMVKLSDGTWQVKEFTNLVDLLITSEQDKKNQNNNAKKSF